MLQAVASEEDGGLGTFAALERDAAFDACLIPEPTGFDVVCAQAGALTFRATVRGRAAHAAMRLEGRSALDRYLGAHLALQAHERALNRDVAHPAMQALALPYPLSVGRIEGGEWSSSVPDRLIVRGPPRRPARRRRWGTARARSRRCSTTARRRPSRSSGPAASSPPARPIRRIRGCAPSRPRCAPSAASARLAGVPYGADMRLFCARGIPAVMVGTNGLELAHAVDERVRVDELAALARIIARAVVNFRTSTAH